MKSVFSKLFLASAFALTVRASATTLQENAQDVSLTIADDTIFSGFAAFNPTLGTLNSVTFYVDDVYVSGQIEATQRGSFTASVSNFLSEFKVYAGVAGSGYNGMSTVFDLKDIPLTVNPGISSQNPKYFTKLTPVNFTVAEQNIIPSTYSFNVSSGDYYSGAAPSFKFYTDISADAVLNGSTSFVFDGATPMVALANLRLVYDYTAYAPVPEPSTYGIGLGVLALAAVAVRRRKVKA